MGRGADGRPDDHHQLECLVVSMVTARQDGKVYIGFGVDSLASSKNSDGYGRSRGEKTVH